VILTPEIDKMPATRLPVRHSIRRTLVAAAIACCFAPATALPNPTGATIVNGQVSMTRQGSMLTVTNSPGSIINWQTFSIGASETTRFVQQSSASTVLNRVVGGEASAILGALQSNGHVFLINPAGIAIGRGAMIDVAGLVASTLNISDADFLGGRLRFQAGPLANAVTNAGEIRTPAGGRVLLVAPTSVENSGVITSPKGEVVLAAGRSVELVDSGTPDVRVEITAPDSQALNLGQIVAQSGQVGIYGSLVRQGGTVNADSAVVGESGRIVLRASREVSLPAGSVTSASGAQGGAIDLAATGGTVLVEGTVAATGTAAQGGTVRLLGENVGVAGSGSIDASGATGGGTVLVGGDRQGANPLVQNARYTYIGSDASVKADATVAGDGGTVIAWADDTARVHGALSARGGPQAGNGGFVETSGGHLAVTRGPDVRAPAGKAGTWLLDPIDVSIIAGVGAVENTKAPFFSPLAESSSIGVDLINAQLDIGSNVEITTTSQGTSAGAQTGNITVSAPILKTYTEGTSSLILRAHNNIVLEGGGSITSTGAGLSVQLLAANFGGGSTGGVTVGAPITTNGGSISLTGAGNIAVSAPLNTTTTTGSQFTSVSLNSSGGSIDVAASVTTGRSGFFATAANGAVNILAPVATTNSSFSSTSKSNFTLGSAATISTGTGSTSITVTDAASSIVIQAGQPVAIASSGGATLRADDMEILAPVVTGSGSITVRANNSGRQMDLGTNTAGKLSLTQAELDQLGTTGTLTLGDTSTTGAITQSASLTGSVPALVQVQSGTSITQNAGTTLALNGNLSVNAPALTLGGATTAGTVTLRANSMDIPGTVTSPSGGTISAAPRSFTTMTVGPTSGSGLVIDAGELSRLSTSGTVQLGDTSTTSSLTVGSSITRSGGALALLVNSNISQSGGATITAPALRVQAFSTVSLGENNAVDVLAGSNGSFTNFTFASAVPLTVGTVDGVSGLSGGPLDLRTDSLTLAGNVFNSSATFSPLTAGLAMDLGSKPGGVLGIDATDLSRLFSTSATFGSASTGAITVSAPMNRGSGSLTLTNDVAQPIHVNAALSAPSGVAITGGPIGVTGAVSSSFGNVAISTTAASPASITGALTAGNDVTISVNTTQPLTLGGAVTAGNNVSVSAGTLTTSAPVTSQFGSTTLVADAITLGAAVSAPNGTVTLRPSTAGTTISLGGADSGGILGLDSTDLSHVSGGAVTIGHSTSGSIIVDAATNFGATPIVQLTTGATRAVEADNPLTAAGELRITADDLGIPVGGSISAAHLTVSTVASGRNIDLGTAAFGTTVMGLDASILGRIALGLGGTLSFQSLGASTIQVSQPVNLSGVTTNVKLTAGTVNVGVSGALSSPGAIELRANTMDIGNSVTSANNDTITVAPRDSTTLWLGTNVGGGLMLDNTEIGRFGTTGTVRFGDPDATSSINVDGSITRAGGPLALITFGNITQAAGQTITTPALRLEADGTVNLTQANQVGTITAYNPFGPVNFTSALPLTVGTVDGQVGFNVDTATLRADTLTIADIMLARILTLAPVTSLRAIDVGTRSGGTLGLDATDLSWVSAYESLVIGDTIAGTLTVSAPTTYSNAALRLVTGATQTMNVAAPLSALYDVSLSAGTINSSASIESQFGGITLAANATSIGGSLTAPFGAVSIAPLTAGNGISLGGLDVGGTLGLGATEIAQVSAPALNLGNSATGPITTGAAVSFGATPTVLLTTASNQGVTISHALTGTGELLVSTNDLAVPAGGSIAMNGVRITPSFGRAVDLGTAAFGTTFMGLGSADIARIDAGTGTLKIDATGSVVTVSQPVAFAGTSAVGIDATTINVNGAVTAPTTLELRANTMDIAAPVTSAGGGDITVTRNSVSFGAMTLGTPTGGELSLSATELGHFTTTGALRIGTTSNISDINITAPVSVSGVGSLVLSASGSSSTGIRQTTTSPLTANNLRLETFGIIDLTANNQIGTIAGGTSSFSRNFRVTNAGLLTIGTVDGIAGLTNGTLVLKADDLAINAAITSNTATVAPRLAGGAIDLGSNPSGVLGIDATELARFSGFSLNVGDTSTGSVTVSAATARTNGTINLVTGPAGLVNVNADLSAPSSVGISSGTINVSAPISTEPFGSISLTAQAPATLNIGAALKAPGGSVTLASDTVNIGAPVETIYRVGYWDPLTGPGEDVYPGSVAVRPFNSGVPVSLGSKASGSLGLTQGELSLLSTGDLVIGSSTTGNITVNAPIVSPASTLELRSAGSITQTPGSTITVRSLSGEHAIGTLELFSGTGVVLNEQNDVNLSLCGKGGAASSCFSSSPAIAGNFEFIGATPLRLQDVRVSVNSTSKVRVTLGNGPSTSGITLQELNAIGAVVDATSNASNTDKNFEKSDEEKEKEQKAAERRKEQEEEKKTGRRPQQCS